MSGDAGSAQDFSEWPRYHRWWWLAAAGSAAGARARPAACIIGEIIEELLEEDRDVP